MNFYVAAIVGTVASFVVGCLWYSVLFGKKWQILMDFSDEKIAKIFIPKRILSAFVCEWFSTACIMGILANSSVNLWLSLLMTTTIIVFTSTKLAIFDGKNVKLICINQGYNIISVVLIGICYWLFV